MGFPPETRRTGARAAPGAGRSHTRDAHRRRRPTDNKPIRPARPPRAEPKERGEGGRDGRAFPAFDYMDNGASDWASFATDARMSSGSGIKPLSTR